MTCTPECAAMRLAIEGIERRIALLTDAVKCQADASKAMAMIIERASHVLDEAVSIRRAERGTKC